MRAHFGLPSVSNEEDKKDRPPITVKFEIPYFTVSGIQVIIIIIIIIIIRDLKIIEKSDLLRTYSEVTPNLLF